MFRAAVLLFSVFLASLAGAHAASASDAERTARRAGARLTVAREAERAVGFAELEALVESHPAACAVALRSLADVLRRRGSVEGARAVRLAAAIPGEEARALWLRGLDAEAHPAVFRAALEATPRRREDPGVLRALLEIVRDEDAHASARGLAAEALGALGGAAARVLLLRPLGPLAEDGTESWLLAACRARGLERLGGRDAGEALLALLAAEHAAVRVAAWEALTALTGERFDVSLASWQAWWDAHPDALAAPTSPSPPGEGNADPDRYASPSSPHVPHYYGVPIDRPRSHVVFCLDVSQSMYGRGIEQARGELTRTLLDFPSTYAFDVVAFNENVHPFATELWPAHPVVKARVLAWLAELETLSYTNLYDAVEIAFGYGGIGRRAVERPSRLDAVFLLSDGAPNRGRYRQDDRVVEAIAELGRGSVPVHAVAAGEEVFPLLRRIAAATGGRFVDAFEFD